MFKAPDTDTAPDAGFKAPDSDDDAPKWSNLPGNIIPDAENILKGSTQTALRIGKGIADIPSDVIESGKEELNGGSPLNTPIAQDVKTVGGGVLNAITAIPKSVKDLVSKDAWIQHPVGNAVTVGSLAAPFLAPEAEAAEGAAKAGMIKPPAPIDGSEFVPRGAMPPEAPPAAAAVPPEAPKALPVIEPGAKTGAPHALFAYNDQFGPEGADRSLYNVYGDPGHPAIQGRGWGSSVTEDDLQKAGIPITGRQPSSAQWDPIPRAAPKATPAPDAVAPLHLDPDAIANDTRTKADEVKNYISKGYEGYAKKPGAAADIADYVQEKSQLMAAQQMGATPLQARQIGHEGMRAIGQYALDNDIVSPTTGLKGMRTKTTSLNEAAGKTIGEIRDLADSMRIPQEHSIDVLQQVRQKFDPVFARGSRSGESSAYAKAIEDIEDAKPTFKGMAELSTKLNHAANEANRLNQPHGAFTDVANEISHINNERVKAIVGPQKAALYEKALRDFGATKKIGEFLKRKEAGEVKRMGPGSLTSNLGQKAMDEFGYRFGAKAANKMAGALKRNPSITKSIPSMFKEFTNQVEDVGHDVAGMAKGGIVPNDVKQWVSSRGC